MICTKGKKLNELFYEPLVFGAHWKNEGLILYARFKFNALLNIFWERERDKGEKDIESWAQ